MTGRDFDLVLHGATGYTGRLTAEYLATVVPPDARVALSGRSVPRLAEVRAGLPPAAAQWPLIATDAADRAALAALAGRARVVATTVGPYVRHGLPLVEACAAAGTHYADVTGETLFVRDSIDACHATAQASGTRIVHACGFDSVPSDIGVWTLADQVRADGSGELRDTVLVVRSLSGGFSGGTIATLKLQADEVRADPARRRVAGHPYALSPDRAGEPKQAESPDLFVAERLADGTWVAPFVMASFNTRIVRRSNALAGWAYGRRFRYREVQATGRAPRGPVVAAGLGLGLSALLLGMAVPPVRSVLDRVLPDPGEGPDEKALATGRFRMELLTHTTAGRDYRATVAVRQHPYAATAVSLSHAALALAYDGDRLPDRAGVLTPATAFGAVLRDRLRGAGFTVDAAVGPAQG